MLKVFYGRKQDLKVVCLLLHNEEIPAVIFESHITNIGKLVIVQNVLNTRKMHDSQCSPPLYN